MLPAEESVPRAPRLALRAPVRCRNKSGGRWSYGWTVDISRTGVLFASPAPASGGDDIEWVVTLSRGAFSGPGVPLLPDLHCVGEIVRIDRGPGGESLVAARITRQTLRRPASAHADAAGGGPASPSTLPAES